MKTRDDIVQDYRDLLLEHLANGIVELIRKPERVDEQDYCEWTQKAGTWVQELIDMRNQLHVDTAEQ